ncbi:MAG: C4-type zinc ribbon domain-containing protein [Coriobacteriales bacterium]|nr:hypothetical protein [Actinomycetes bacterium]
MDQGRALLELSEKDLEITRLTKQLEDLPEKTAILELRHKMKDIEGVAQKAREFVADAEREVKRAEDEVASLRAKMDSEQVKISSGQVVNVKELQSMSREIDSLRRQVDKKENDVLKAMERLEAGRTQANKIAETLEKAAAREKRLIEEYRARGGELQSHIDTLRRERALLAAQLDEELLSRYEKTREAKHGIGVGVLSGGMCSACRIDLPAGKVQALEEGGPIGECPNCHRLLVVRGRQR